MYLSQLEFIIKRLSMHENRSHRHNRLIVLLQQVITNRTALYTCQHSWLFLMWLEDEHAFSWLIIWPKACLKHVLIQPATLTMACIYQTRYCASYLIGRSGNSVRTGWLGKHTHIWLNWTYRQLPTVLKNNTTEILLFIVSFSTFL